MLILFIFWVWLISLVVQPVAIIILAVKSRNYNKQITELSKALNGPGGPPSEPVKPADTVPERPAGPPPVEQITVVIKPAVSPDRTEPAGSAAGSPSPDAPEARVRKPFPKPDMNLFQGAGALIIGVVFVVLAGLIFATTTWQTLPNVSKIIMIFGFSGGFFGVSRMASKILKIKKTSQAFYILGSVFLFLTVLAVGYFELPGHGFTLAEQQRFNVLFAGSLVTELALLAGIRQFQDRVYTNACFWGISTTIFFLVKTLSLETADCIKWMACYSTMLIWVDELTGNKREEMPPFMNAGFSAFAGLHFGIFSLLLVTLASREWLAAMAGHLVLNNSAVSVSTAAAFGILTTGIAVMARKQGRRDFQIMHSVLTLLFWHYLGMCIRTGLIYQIFAGFMLTVIWFFRQKKRDGSVTGACCHTLVLAIDALVVMMIALVNRNSIGEFMAASVSVMMLTAVLEYWSRRYPGLRVIIPVALLPLTITVEGIITMAGAGRLEYHWLVFLFLAAVVVWDVIKRDRFGIAILVIGTVAQLFFWAADRNLALFSLLLSGYLLIKSGFMEDDNKEMCEQGSCLYLLSGIFFITDYWTDKFMLQILCVTAVFAVAYAFQERRGAAGRRFRAVTGLVLLLLNQGAFYLDASCLRHILFRACWYLPCFTVSFTAAAVNGFLCWRPYRFFRCRRLLHPVMP